MEDTPQGNVVYGGDNVKKLVPDRYIGDGVYASFDGYHIWLDTRMQDPVHRIALEPPVMAQLDQYRRDIQTAIFWASLEARAKGEEK